MTVPQSAWGRGAFLSCQEKGWGLGSKTTGALTEDLGPVAALPAAAHGLSLRGVRGSQWQEVSCGPCPHTPEGPALRLCRGSWSG